MKNHSLSLNLDILSHIDERFKDANSYDENQEPRTENRILFYTLYEDYDFIP